MSIRSLPYSLTQFSYRGLVRQCVLYRVSQKQNYQSQPLTQGGDLRISTRKVFVTSQTITYSKTGYLEVIMQVIQGLG